MTITVYFLQASRAIRITWLLEELGVEDYKIEFADRVNQKAPQAFKEASGNPLGKFPAIRDNDLALHESGAILEYLCSKYDADHRLIPSDEYARSKVLIWVHAAEGAFLLHGLAVTYARWNFPKDVLETHPDALDRMEEGLSVNVGKDLDWLEAELNASTGRFLVGDGVTAADVMMVFSVDFILERDLGVRGRSWPKVNAWLARCKATETYKRAVEKSGYTLHPKTT